MLLTEIVLNSFTFTTVINLTGWYLHSQTLFFAWEESAQNFDVPWQHGGNMATCFGDCPECRELLEISGQHVEFDRGMFPGRTTVQILREGNLSSVTFQHVTDQRTE